MPRSTKREVTEEIVAATTEAPVAQPVAKKSKKSKKDRKDKKKKSKDKKKKSKRSSTETTVDTTTAATTASVETAAPVAATTSAATTSASTTSAATTSSANEDTKTSSVENVTELRGSTDTLLSSLIATVQSRIASDKQLLTQLRELNRQVVRERKDTDKALKKMSKSQRKRSSGNKAPGGFTKPTPISQLMCEFLGVDSGTEMPRTDVTRRINAYVKEHNLQNPENKKQILADNKLSTLLFLKAGDELTYFNLQRYMKVHFLKKDKETGIVSEFVPPS